MHKYYTIGETAEYLGVSTQTLRYYDKIGLISPAKTDMSNGYRYYTFSQFHYIDRIKYLQKIGMSLYEIKDVIKNGSVKDIVVSLEKDRNRKLKDLKDLETRINDINWYINYFTYFEREHIDSYFYKRTIMERYVMKVPCYYGEPLADMELRLAKKKALPEYNNLEYHRQYGYMIDIPSVFSQKFYPKEYFIFLSGKPDIEEDSYAILPGGEYLCFRSQVLTEVWNKDALNNFFRGCMKPAFGVALEFEDNLHEYSKAWYEIQLYMEKIK